MRLADLPTDMRLGAIAGLQVYDWSNPLVEDYVRKLIWLPEGFKLRYDEMFPAQRINAILVGEEKHFLWRMKMIRDNQAARRAAADHITTTASRILGEPWELSL